MTRLALRHILRRAGDDQFAAALAGVRAEVDDPVGGLDYVEVVFDDDDAMTRVHDALENLKQHADVVEVKSRGRLVKEEERALRGGRGGMRRRGDRLALTPTLSPEERGRDVSPGKLGILLRV